MMRCTAMLFKIRMRTFKKQYRLRILWTGLCEEMENENALLSPAECMSAAMLLARPGLHWSIFLIQPFVKQKYWCFCELTQNRGHKNFFHSWNKNLSKCWVNRFLAVEDWILLHWGKSQEHSCWKLPDSSNPTAPPHWFGVLFFTEVSCCPPIKGENLILMELLLRYHLMLFRCESLIFAVDGSVGFA